MKILKALCLILIMALIIPSARASRLAGNPIDKIVTAYLDVKNALVNGDGNTASAKAKDLVNALSANTAAELSADQQKTFAKFRDKLLFDARHISSVNIVDHQREHFENLSANMYDALKALKLNTTTLYEQYCPMKKAYWLSETQQIKNPYFGSQMLTCGKVTATLAPAK
ncbi:DUF3347 domain-containing protein [Mucilaginibacter sp. L3T2-6]|uniref:DUF3347 domain-containing protein n=1 Tax=Mucilaginibacter sp. L3T2-6 TaxID=3062491 RepID=UPI0026759830|nr:DUF3347 domain-containing protein [Mucilaginibacter sp. L3T2-6]MDO3644183.1 DUF3347 domain-containing protein [Mucilaginibacter sp. L3T2-6]MDV6216720.1 DUF3347 domain-containing protein [Mucilaginibacter sp. L3T2-6]